MHPMADVRAPASPSGARPPSALPSVGARVFAFLCIAVAGAAGAFIGYGFTDLQCRGDCTVQTGLGALVGATLAAGGTAVVVVLTLRAMGEWKTIKERGTGPPDGATSEATSCEIGARDDTGPDNDLPRVR